MLIHPALAAYTKTRICSASPGQLVVTLYDAAIAALTQAITAEDLQTRGSNIDKVHAIFNELIASLNFRVESELPRELFRIYNYLSNRLIDASICDDTSALEEIRNLLMTLRSAWAEVEASPP